MTLLDEFIDYIEFHAGRSIYVWGGQGEDIKTLSDEKIISMETSLANARRAIALKNKRINVDGAKAFDCSGLGMYFFDNLKGLYPDMTADDMMRMSRRIDKNDIRPGDMAYKVYSGGRAYHMGYVSRDKKIIEAKGRDDGVVKRDIDAGTWNVFARFPAFEDAGISDTPRLLKLLSPTMKGEDVKKVQEALIKKGYSVGSSGIDGSYGPATKKAVISFQKANGLTADGIVGEKTRKKLFEEQENIVLTRLLKLTSPTMKGEDIKNIQRALTAKGFSVGASGIDGSYGPRTKAAVIAFQKASGLAADGIVGKNTAAALGIIYTA